MSIALDIMQEYLDTDNSGKACCPFHDENTPSFGQIKGCNRYFCFGCGWSGDVFKFVMDLEGISFNESVERVEEITGMTYEEVKNEVSNNVQNTSNNNKIITPLKKEYRKQLADWSYIKDESGKLHYRSTNNYRGIRDETYEKLKFLHKFDNQGNLIRQFYPEYGLDKDIFVLRGFKPRTLPKDFKKKLWKNKETGDLEGEDIILGETGIDSCLSGMELCEKGGRILIIVGGEIDRATVYQVFNDHQNTKNKANGTEYTPPDIVCPTSGEGSAARQVQLYYDFVSSYEKIYIGMDSDKAGDGATESIAKVLPKDKLYIITWSAKDPNELLQSGRQSQIINDFWRAKPYIDTHIQSSANIEEKIPSLLNEIKITLPPYMKVLESNMRRAFTTAGKVVNLVGYTSVGKSEHVNNIVKHWIFHERLTPLILSLEATAEEYALDMIGRYIGINFDIYTNTKDIEDILNKPEIIKKRNELFLKEDGSPRFYIIDDRTGDADSVKGQIKYAVEKYGCNVVVIDVLSDLIRYLDTSLQEKFMTWERNFVKSGVSILNVCHTVKPKRDKEGNLNEITEYDIIGSGSIPQSAHITILLDRDKEHPDPLQRNTTRVRMSKCRRGITGPAGSWVFEMNTKQCYDSEEYMRMLDDNRNQYVQQNYAEQDKYSEEDF